jgi:hypothetical protein
MRTHLWTALRAEWPLEWRLAIGMFKRFLDLRRCSMPGQSPLVNAEEGRISYLVDEKRVVELPLNGRNALQLIELQPGSAANPGNLVLGGSAGGNSARSLCMFVFTRR